MVQVSALIFGLASWRVGSTSFSEEDWRRKNPMSAGRLSRADDAWPVVFALGVLTSWLGSIE